MFIKRFVKFDDFNIQTRLSDANFTIAFTVFGNGGKWSGMNMVCIVAALLNCTAAIGAIDHTVWVD